MTHCPICHARLKTELDHATTHCQRCGSELTLLCLIEQKAKHWLQLAYYHVINGRRQAALDCVERSLLLANTPLAKTLHAFIVSRKQTLIPCDFFVL